MKSDEEMLKQLNAALEIEPRINLHHSPIRFAIHDGAVTLDGDVDSIAAKKLARRLAQQIAGDTPVEDHLRVQRRDAKGDGEMLDLLGHFLLRECDLKNCTLRRRDKGQAETLHQADGDDSSGDIEFSVADGVIRLDGHVLSLSHRRIVEVMAWWVPGCQDVDNHLEVRPAEQDNDDEITDALRLALELDPLVHPEQIGVKTRLGIVSLDGVVQREEEKRAAEVDAWCVPGVEDVVNHLEVMA